MANCYHQHQHEWHCQTARSHFHSPGEKKSDNIITLSISNMITIAQSLQIFVNISVLFSYCTSLSSWPLILIEHKSDGSSTWNCFIWKMGETFTTVFVDTRLWKTKHSRKRFQKFPSVFRVIDMSDRNPPITAR